MPGTVRQVRGEIRALTGLRGVAAIWVMVAHYTENTPYADLDLIAHGYNAVDLFFVLSGFVLAMVYGDGFAPRAQPHAFRRFLGHRIARLVPLYVVATLASFALVRSGVPIYGDPHASVLALGVNLAMVQFWLWPMDSLNGPGWSISTEWAANLAFPVLAAAVLRPPLRAAAAVAAGGAVVLVGSELASTAQYWGTPVLFSFRHVRVPQPLLGCAMEFMLGMFAWRLRQQAAWTRVLGGDAVLLPLIALMLAWTTTGSADAWFVALACPLVVGLSFGVSRVARVLAAPVPHWLGVVSFSIYLVHAPLISAVPWLWAVAGRAGLPHDWAVATLAAMGGSVALAALTYRTIERPARAWLRRG
jgi:peptidoglycan/LPS O-acetylase OafA/YrhL